MSECQYCHRELIAEVRTYPCFPDTCGECVDARLAVPPGAGVVTARLQLTPEQIREIEEREHASEEPSIEEVLRDPLATPLTRRDLLEALEELRVTLHQTRHVPGVACSLLSAQLRLRWTWPEPERASATPEQAALTLKDDR